LRRVRLMSDETNVNESAELESRPDENPEAGMVSDAMEELDAIDPGPALAEPDRKAEIQKAMRVTARENTVRKRDLKRAHLKG
jgi:hypothetical protein